MKTQIKTGDDLQALLDKAIALGEKKGCTVYNLLHRRAGWAVYWSDDMHMLEQIKKMHPLDFARTPEEDRWRLGLVVYQYKPTLREALEAEIERLMKLPDVQEEAA